MADGKGQCKALKAGGGRCSKTALDSSDYCYAHSRETAEQRRKNAAAGGHARSRRAPSELATIKGQLRTIAGAVLNGEMDKGTAVVVNQVFNSILRTVELERRLDKHEELMERLAQLEAEIERRGGGSWTWRNA